MANRRPGPTDRRGRRNAVILNADAALFPVAAFLGQRLVALNRRSDTDIIVVSDSFADLEIAGGLAPDYRLLGFNPGQFAERLPPGWMHPIFHRYFLPAILAAHYKRLLYIDIDTYPHDARLFDLFDLAMEGNIVGAVRDALIGFPASGHSTEQDATIKNPERKYLNTGVMLIDVDAFIQEKLLDRLCALIKKRRKQLAYPDQSALNILLDGGWLELSPSMNMLRAEYNSFVRDAFPPVITHFAGATKPWDGVRFVLDHPVRQELQEFIAGSPWKHFLGRSRSFDQAWQAAARGEQLQKEGPEVYIALGVINRKDLLRHLRTTRFADVAAGIVTPRLDLLPE